MQIKIILKFNKTKEAEQTLMKGVDRGMDDLIDFIFAKSQDLVPVDESTLKKSGHVEREYLTKSIEYDAPHTSFIEYGTKPHYLPRSAIDGELTGWAMRVLKLSKKEANKAAWGIAGKIAALGGEAQPYLRPAVDIGIGKAPEIFQKQVYNYRKS